MSLKFIVVGKTKTNYFAQSEQEYLKRLKKYCNLSYVAVPSSKNTVNKEVCLKMEEEHLFKNIGRNDYVILLDEQGTQFSSRKFAAQFNKQLVQQADITFIIGGAFGFSENIRQRANASWSLSMLTFPHHMVRTIFLEQLYRAFTILNGGQYHND